MQSTGCKTDDADAHPSVQEGIIEIRSLEGRHSPILASLSVEDKVDGEDGSPKDTGAIQQTLRQTTGIGSKSSGLRVSSAKGISRFCESGKR